MPLRQAWWPRAQARYDFAGSGRAHEEHIVGFTNEGACGQGLEHGPCDSVPIHI